MVSDHGYSNDALREEAGDMRGSDAPHDRALETADAYTLTVNGRAATVEGAWLGESLLHVLRERLGLPGTKSACDQGECGSCSVLLDGVLVCACCVMAADAVDAELVTVEGLGVGAIYAGGDGRDDVDLSPVQRTFVEQGAVQCGFCTPGLVMAVHDLLDRNPDPSELDVREAISGNLCRCTGYGRILAAVTAARDARDHG